MSKLFGTRWTVAYQAPPSMGFSKQEYWSGLPFPSPGNLPDPVSNPGLPHSRQKTSEKNVRSKPEGKWSFRQYAGKIPEPLEQGGDSIASAFPKVILLHITNDWRGSTPNSKEGPLHMSPIGPLSLNQMPLGLTPAVQVSLWLGPGSLALSQVALGGVVTGQ